MHKIKETRFNKFAKPGSVPPLGYQSISEYRNLSTNWETTFGKKFFDFSVGAGWGKNPILAKFSKKLSLADRTTLIGSCCMTINEYAVYRLHLWSV